MSDLYINIRFLHWHLQVKNNWDISISRNWHHKLNNYKDGYFKIYQFFN